MQCCTYIYNHLVIFLNLPINYYNLIWSCKIECESRDTGWISIIVSWSLYIKSCLILYENAIMISSCDTNRFNKNKIYEFKEDMNQNPIAWIRINLTS